MRTKARSAAPLLLASTAVAWAIFTAAPAGAEPGGDSTVTSPTTGESTVLPVPISTFDRVWNQFVPPNPIVPQSPVAAFGPLVEQIFPIFR